METKNVAVSAGVRWGLLLGAISIIFFLLLYIINYELLISAAYTWGGFAILIVVLLVAGFNFRKQVGGYVNYGSAFIFEFITFMVSVLASTAFTLLLVTLIDPGLPDRLVEPSFEATMGVMESFGVSNDEIMNQTMEQLENNPPLAVGQQLKGVFFSLFIGAFFAAILALFIRKKKPDFA